VKFLLKQENKNNKACLKLIENLTTNSSKISDKIIFISSFKCTNPIFKDSDTDQAITIQNILLPIQNSHEGEI